MVGENQSMK